jgi:hypothetical protein
MENLILTAILLLLVTQLALFIIAFFRAQREYHRFIGELSQFLQPAADGGPSPLATIASALIQQGSKSVAAEIKTSLMGQISGVQRGLEGIEGDVMVDSNPLIGALVGQFPSVKKRLLKNPALLQFILGLAQRKKGESSPEDGAVTKSFEF